MKAVLISIQPKWCEKIAIGEKTIEVLKSRPKLVTPFKCYIYCTKSKKHFLQSKDNMFFYCEESDFIGKHGAGLYQRLNGKVIGEFVCDKVENIFSRSRFWLNEDTLKYSCLSAEQIWGYANGAEKIYGWHISDLKIYDKPKELGEFKSVKVINRYHKKEYDKYEKLSHSHRVQVTYFDRPPQSWCYVEDLKNG